MGNDGTHRSYSKMSDAGISLVHLSSSGFFLRTV